MSDLFWLPGDQIERPRPSFPRTHGKLPVDDRRLLSGKVFVDRNGLRWREVPAAKVHTRHIKRSMQLDEAALHAQDRGAGSCRSQTGYGHGRTSYLKEQRMAASPQIEGRLGRVIGRTRGDMTLKPYAVTDADSRP